MWTNPINLVEHNEIPIPDAWAGTLSGLEEYLDTVWKTRTVFDDDDPEQPVSHRQPFLKFEVSMGKPTIKAGQYVGFIQYAGQTLQILPKLFQKEQADMAFRHLLWWLDYGQRIRFPFADLLTDSEAIDNFPEALIRYFARTTFKLIHAQPYHQYEEVTETMPYLRGRLNTQAYVNASLSRGNWHQLVCDYEPFQFNNRLNQIIKFVARRLGHLCRFTRTRQNLEQIVFVLDEVDDLPCTVYDCDAIRLNRFFQEYERCLDMCRFFLTDQYLNRQNNQQRHFCFLVPMDMVYEDFIAGVVKTELSNQFDVGIQKESHLAKTWPGGKDVFKIKNDLLLTDKQTGARLVVDTKYKIRTYEPGDRKAGISQPDLYQMVSYGLRRDTRQVVLLYPTKHGGNPAPPQAFMVDSSLMRNQPIHISAVDLTITGTIGTQQEFSENVVKGVLVDQLTKAFKPVIYP